jgi:hypothetical protein
VKLPLGFDGRGLVVSKKKIRNLEFLLPSKEIFVTGSVKAPRKDMVVSCRKADKPNVFHLGVYRLQRIYFLISTLIPMCNAA